MQEEEEKKYENEENYGVMWGGGRGKVGIDRRGVNLPITGYCGVEAGVVSPTG